MLAVALPNARAQDSLPEPTPKPESVLVNQKLVAKVEEVEKSALRIRSEEEGLAYLGIQGHSYVPKSQFVFFRRRGTRLQMIAMGVVEGDRVNPKDRTPELVINIDRDSIVKYPQVGDLAVPLADPLANSLGEKRDSSDTAVIEDKPTKSSSQPGYLELGAGLIFGRLTSSGSPQVGGGKNTQAYRFMNQHFEYFSGLLPFGISYESHGGNLPTSTYEGAVVKSQETVSQFNLYYRYRPGWSPNLALMPKVFMLSDSLNTDNTGSELFTTAITAMGVGLRVQYCFAPDVWKPASPVTIAVQPLNLFAELGFSPSVTALDAGPSRGNGSPGSTLLEYRVGATVLFWLNFVPLLKRWVFQGSYGARNYSLSFQGPTVSEAGNPITVPEGIKMNEAEREYFRFFLGVRFGDPLEALFGGKEEAKK
jgi:hypothetical protein